MVNINIPLSDTLHKTLKILSTSVNKTLTQLVPELLTFALTHPKYLEKIKETGLEIADIASEAEKYTIR